MKVVSGCDPGNGKEVGNNSSHQGQQGERIAVGNLTREGSLETRVTKGGLPLRVKALPGDAQPERGAQTRSCGV